MRRTTNTKINKKDTEMTRIPTVQLTLNTHDRKKAKMKWISNVMKCCIYFIENNSEYVWCYLHFFV